MGQAIIQKIQLRTLEGLDVNGKRFAKYSKSYSTSKEFAVAGKSSTVDLRFTHDMMNSIEVLESSSGSITLGFADKYTADKATWAAASDNGPSREFLGISDRELSSILGEYAAPKVATRSLALDILQRILTIGK